MRVCLLPSSIAGTGEDQYLTSFLVNDSVVIDAGSIGFFQTTERQAKCRHVFLSHAHLDHIASLPILLENAYSDRHDPIAIYGSQDVLDCLESYIFNDRIWPDFFRLSDEGLALVRKIVLRPREPVTVEGIIVTPIPVDHAVSTMGFALTDENATVLIPSDTGPTQEIWDYANSFANLAAVFLEVAFPNSMSEIAQAAKHLTPALFAAEVRKVERIVPFYVVHLKPPFRAEILNELSALGLPNVKVVAPGREYQFG